MNKITHRDLLDLNGVFSRYGSVTGAPWFSYAVSKNLSLFTPVLKAIQSASQFTEEEQAFEGDKQVLLLKHAKKDAQGSPVSYPVTFPDGTQNIRYDVGNLAEYESELASLVASKYPSVDALRTQRIASLNTLLDSEIEIGLTSLRASDIPPNLLSANDMTILFRCGILEWDLKRK